jgi:hypothetical protein
LGNISLFAVSCDTFWNKIRLMKKINILVAVVGLVGIIACDKSNNFGSNLSTITEPYVLIAAEAEGGIRKSNDGKNFDQWLANGSAFSNDIMFVDSNIIHLKNKLYVGKVTNGNYAAVQVQNFSPYSIALPNNPQLPNIDNTSLYDASNKAIYVCGTSVVWQSLDNGKTWNPLTFPASTQAIKSITQLDNKEIYFLAQDNKLYRNVSGTPGGTITIVTTAPPTVALSLWTLASRGNTLLLCDAANKTECRYSTNGGAAWTSCGGFLNKGRVIMARNMPANNNFYLGIDSLGLYKLDGNNVVKVEGGLPPKYLRVWDMVHKRNVYRSGDSKDYFYLATNYGLFLSENGGVDWQKVSDIEYSALD